MQFSYVYFSTSLVNKNHDMSHLQKKIIIPLLIDPLILEKKHALQKPVNQLQLLVILEMRQYYSALHYENCNIVIGQ